MCSEKCDFDYATAHCHWRDVVVPKMETDVTALRAENAKLREALEQARGAVDTATYMGWRGGPDARPWVTKEQIVQLIDAALSPSEPPDSDRGGLNGECGDQDGGVDTAVAAPRRPR